MHVSLAILLDADRSDELKNLIVEEAAFGHMLADAIEDARYETTVTPATLLFLLVHFGILSGG